MDVVLSVTADGWDEWGKGIVKRQPLSRVQQLIGPHPTVDQAKAAILLAIKTAGAGGRVLFNVGHGAGGGQLQTNEGTFEITPGKVMTIGGRNVANTFVDVFYDVNLSGPPSISDMENDLKNNPQSPRLTRWKVYQEISKGFKNGQLREVVLLTCKVGNATEFLRKVANDWGVVIRAYRLQVGLLSEVITSGRTKTSHFYMHLVNNPPIGKRADELVAMEEEIPFDPGQTLLVGPPLVP